jgi:membrane protease YdiL (CAAX protease family)
VDFLKTIIISPTEPRLRVVWRILIQSSLMGILLVCATAPVVLSFGISFSGYGLLFLQVAEFFGVTISVFLARRFLDKRSFSSLGLKINRRGLMDIAVGFWITFFIMGLVYLVEYGLGWLTFIGFAWDTDTVETIIAQTMIVLATFMLVGWNEELLSRGYHLQNFTSSLNVTWAVVLSSVIFGILHLSNLNANFTGAIGITFSGIFLAFAYLRTRQLWLPIGLHIGWNFFEGAVFGFPVSGLETYRLIRIAVNGPELWTGGVFGPEGGLVAIPALLLGATLVFIYTQNRPGPDSENLMKPKPDHPTH